MKIITGIFKDTGAGKTGIILKFLLLLDSIFIIAHLLFGQLTLHLGEKQINLFKMRHLLLLWIILLILELIFKTRETLPTFRQIWAEHKHEILLFILLIILLIPRLMSVGYGLPHLYDIDESYVVPKVVTMMEDGTLNHKYFKYGGTYYYIMFAVFTVYFLLKHAPVIPFAQLHSVPLGQFYEVARIVNSCIGIFSVLLVYLIGKKVRDKDTGLAAAAIVGLSLSHFLNSVTVRMDILVMLLTSAAFYFIWNIKEKGEKKDYIWASVFITFAGGTKFYGFFMFISLIFAHFLRKNKKGFSNKNLVLAFVITAVVFIMTNPFIILDYTTFMRDFSHLAEQIIGANEHWSSLNTTPANRYMQFMFFNGIGWLAGALFLAALLKFLVKPDRDKGLLLLFPFVHFFMLIGSRQVHHRFMLAALPYIAILTVMFLREIIDSYLQKRKTIVYWSIVILLLIQPAWKIIENTAVFIKPTTSEQAYDWMLKNIPLSSALYIQGFTVRPEEGKYTFDYFSKPGLVKAKDLREPGKGYNYIIIRNWEGRPDYLLDQHVQNMTEEIARFSPINGKTSGPDLSIYRVRPVPSYEFSKGKGVLDFSIQKNYQIPIGIPKEDAIYLDSSWGQAKEDVRGIFRWIGWVPAHFFFALPEKPDIRSIDVEVLTFNEETNKHLVAFLDISLNGKNIKSVKLVPNRKARIRFRLPGNDLFTGAGKVNDLSLRTRYSTENGTFFYKKIGLVAPIMRVHSISMILGN
ncbi:MAG: glycosyltransferase family 39 protein [Acidobacteria bacterium]|nr:glycosyltransferase family 39 protein [Acidobacteriota bacterium]